MILKNEREKVVFEIKRMQEMGLVINTSGNISIKKDDLIAISPSGVSYDNLKSEDIVVLDKDKKIVEGKLNITPVNELFLNFSYSYINNIENFKKICSCLVEIVTNSKHNEKKYYVSIEHAMRVINKVGGLELLEGVVDVGFKIEKVK